MLSSSIGLWEKTLQRRQHFKLSILTQPRAASHQTRNWHRASRDRDETLLSVSTERNYGTAHFQQRTLHEILMRAVP